MSAGTLTVQFDNQDQATITLSDEPGAPGQALPKRSKIITVRPQRLDIPPVPRPDFLVGSFSQTIIVFDTGGGRYQINAPQDG